MCFPLTARSPFLRPLLALPVSYPSPFSLSLSYFYSLPIFLSLPFIFLSSSKCSFSLPFIFSAVSLYVSFILRPWPSPGSTDQLMILKRVFWEASLRCCNTPIQGIESLVKGLGMGELIQLRPPLSFRRRPRVRGEVFRVLTDPSSQSTLLVNRTPSDHRQSPEVRDCRKKLGNVCISDGKNC